MAWHKTPTTSDIQAGVELAIQEVVRKGKIAPAQIESVKIGTTVSAGLTDFICSDLSPRADPVLTMNIAIRQRSSLAESKQA